MTIGEMTMPPCFKYREVYLRGRPHHEKYDGFWLKHPPMSSARWAKIFAPFDALDGFREAIRAKDVLYCDEESETASCAVGSDSHVPVPCHAP